MFSTFRKFEEGRNVLGVWENHRIQGCPLYLLVRRKSPKFD